AGPAAPRRRRADRLQERRAAVSGALAARRRQRGYEPPIRVVAEPGESLRRRRPRDLIHLVIVLADLLDRPHEKPLHGLLHAPAAPLEPIGHGLELTRDLAEVAGLLADLAQGRVGALLTRRQRAFGQRPHRAVAEIASSYQQDPALDIDNESPR